MSRREPGGRALCRAARVVPWAHDPRPRAAPVKARLSGHRLMLVAAAVVAAVLLAAAVLGVPTPARAHVLLALGVAPLIFCAMIYFTPVLTRGEAPGIGIVWIPLAALIAGALAVLGMSGGVGIPAPWSAALALLATMALAYWMWTRARRALLAAHAGLQWYLLALGAFALGLLAILAAHRWPGAWAPLRALHLHLNLVGFVGLTAVGTLNVLLPTAGQYQDPTASGRLRRHWPWAAGGSALIAVGALGYPLLGAAGVAAWLYPLAVLVASTLRRPPLWRWHRSALGLAVALLGWSATLIAGAVHGFGGWSGEQVLWLAAFGFLLPLITGAVAVLLPVWMDPASTRCRAPAERIMSRHTGVRVVAFAGAAAAVVLSAHGVARAAAALGVAAFAAAAIAAAVLCLRSPRAR